VYRRILLERKKGKIMLKLNYAVVLGSVILVTTRFTYSIASGPSGYTASPSYGGYNQQVQQQQQQQQQNYPQQQQQDQFYSEASYQKEGTTPQEDPAAVTATSEPTAGEEDILPPLPEGWTEHLDPNSGQYYYFNAADGTTSWDRPSLPEDIEQGGVVESENKEEDPRLSSISAENSPRYEQFSGNTGKTNFNENSTPEQQQQPAHDDLTGGGNNVITKTGPGEMIGSSSEADRWQPNQNQSPDLKQPEPEESSGPPQQQQENNWESQRQTDYPMTTSGWGSSPSIQSNSTASLVDEGERQPEEIKQEYRGQPTHMNQQQVQPGGWGLPRKDEESSSQSEPWGVTKSTEQRSPQEPSHLPKQQQQSPPQPIRETPPPANSISPDQTSSEGKWGIPQAAAITQPPPGSEQRQSWQQQPPQQHNTQGSYQLPDSDQRPPPRPVHQVPPQQHRLPPQQQHRQPTQPPYLQRQQQQQPQPGQYNPNVSPGPGQYNQQYGGPNNYGRGYPTQQPPPSQQTSSGQVVSQGVEQGTTAVKEALSSTWKGLLGFGAKTREVAGTAREQVVTGATSASQTLGAKSSSKSCGYDRSVFIQYYCVPF
jgi:hypothetical protein